jgi:hypothetical protein
MELAFDVNFQGGTRPSVLHRTGGVPFAQDGVGKFVSSTTRWNRGKLASRLLTHSHSPRGLVLPLANFRAKAMVEAHDLLIHRESGARPRGNRAICLLACQESGGPAPHATRFSKPAEKFVVHAEYRPRATISGQRTFPLLRSSNAIFSGKSSARATYTPSSGVRTI